MIFDCVCCCYSCTFVPSESCESETKFRKAINCCRWIPKASKLTFANKTKDFITSKKLGSRDFWGIANSVLSGGKTAIPSLFNDSNMLSSVSDKAKIVAKTFSEDSNIDDSEYLLPSVSSKINLKLHNISVTPEVVQNHNQS